MNVECALFFGFNNKIKFDLDLYRIVETNYQRACELYKIVQRSIAGGHLIKSCKNDFGRED